MNKISPYAKTVVGFLVGALTAYLGAKDGGVNGDEWLTILIAGLAGSGFVYAVPNKDPKAKHQNESVQPPERGETVLGLVVTVLVVLLLVWLVLTLVHR